MTEGGWAVHGEQRGALLRRHLGDRRFLLTLPCAVALQILHPVIASALAEHASNRLWEHKRRTVSQMIYMAYSARDPRTVIRFGHEHVKGEDASGRRYHALHPEVFFFQHATYVDSLVASIELFGGGLTEPAREQLYSECCEWYLSYGVSARHMPETWAEFTDYFETQCAETLSLTDRAAALAPQVLRPDAWLPGVLPGFAVRAMLREDAAALLDARPSAVDRAAFGLYAATVRGAIGTAPRRLRYLPQTRIRDWEFTRTAPS
ncbi:DUF2236 domain-containing protein [Nocardia sp. 2]|uniref:DUF2236 domain-containing protein n=1 Tax=Nocardia acididurans TaxID=2802282 RepID=A0ABS1MAJ6_9NOCA|nr:oxygenase MpaB family protein [Nocardia acididurans]MBL1077070.1 DUF2236 domain-containing protein [Nocardia acididurans]